MRVEAPTSEADRAPLVTTALTFLACLALGLGVARWTVGARPPSAHDPSALEGAPREGDAREGDSTAEEPPPGTSATEGGEGVASEERVEPSAPEMTAELVPAEVAPAEEVAPAIVAPAIVAPVEASPTVAPGPARARLARGRVAYLRCEGGGSGGTCARDHAIEDAIWSAIDTLPTCGSGPLPPGQADLVVALGGEDGVEVRARDTFAADVVRLDGASTVACLSPAILADPALSASTRRVVLSFRFSLDAL